MKKYSFTMTKKEIMEFCIRAILEQMRLQYVVWLVILAAGVLETLVVRWLGIFFAVFFIAFITITVCRSYSMTKKNLYGKTRSIWVEDGFLKAASETYAELPCNCIQVVRKTSNLLMLGQYQAKKRLAWYMMPLRVFSNRQEMDEFLNMIHNSQTSWVQNDEILPAENTEEGLFNLSFIIDEKKWERVFTDTTEIIRSGVMGDSKTGKKLWALLGLCLAIFLISCISGSDMMYLSFVFIMTFLMLLLVKSAKVNPEKTVKKQLKKGILQNNVYGDWQVLISETGVTWNGPGQGKVMMPWEKFSWLVEKETAFYLFWSDKRHFVMILKECIGSYEQAEALKRLCMENRISFTVAKKPKYTPDWVFYLLMAALIGMYLLSVVRLAIKDSTETIQEGMQDSGVVYYDWADDFNPADYPDYVPVEKQAEVLKEHGIAVSDKIVETAKDTMDEYERMRIYIEGYPYTWILMEMGAPDYNDDWEITGYSDEVFWFDFEGMDISTDYITILEGMIALAPQSAISSVTNIKEDTTDVDWDKGRGSIEVSLEWNGQEYSWKMDMQYDWIDEEILGSLNSLLEKTDEEERFYVTGDNGQGAIVFYCNRRWAKEFEKATGLEMSVF